MITIEPVNSSFKCNGFSFQKWIRQTHLQSVTFAQTNWNRNHNQNAISTMSTNFSLNLYISFLIELARDSSVFWSEFNAFCSGAEMWMAKCVEFTSHHLNFSYQNNSLEKTEIQILHLFLMEYKVINSITVNCNGKLLSMWK